VENKQPMSDTEEMANMQAEFPATGTPLNPVEAAWAFTNSAAAPVDDLARAMQQGE